MYTRVLLISTLYPVVCRFVLATLSIHACEDAGMAPQCFISFFGVIVSGVVSKCGNEMSSKCVKAVKVGQSCSKL